MKTFLFADVVPDDEIIRLRIYKEDGEWFLDGRDKDGNYSSSCWSYDSFSAALADAPEFATTFPNLGRAE